MTQQEVIGLTGGMCSGKDSWADFLQEEFGYEHHSTSDIARLYISEHELGEPTRDLTREVATELRTLNGSDYLMRTAINNARTAERVVISGLYVVPEVIYLKRIGGIIINIATDDDIRFQRMSKRGRDGELPEIDEYFRLMNNDLHSDQTDQRLTEVIDLADYSIDGSIPIRDTERCRNVAQEVLSKIGRIT